MNNKQEVLESIETLKKAMPTGTVVFTVLHHVSNSGMMRILDVYTIKDNIPLRYSWSVAQVLGWTYDKKHEGIKVTGCGMDMGFHLVDSLNRVLYGQGGANPGDKLVQRWI